jgi:hypothetical protein
VTRLAAISSLFQRGNRHSQVTGIVFKHQSFTCTRYGGCKRRGKARVQNTYVRIRVVVSERFSDSPQSRVERTRNRSRNAPTTPSHHIFDVYRRCRSGNDRVKLYDPRKILESSDKNTNTMASEKGLHVADLLEAPGLTSTLRERLQAADADGDGIISASEMMDVMQREITATRYRKMMVSLLAALSVACVLIIAAVVGLTYAVVEMSKDTSVENNVLVGKDGLQPLSTATLQQTTPLRDLYKATSPSEVDWLTHVTVPFDDGKAILKIQNVHLVPGERVRFDTSSQDVSVVVTADGVTVSGQKSSNGRRLLGDDDSTGTGNADRKPRCQSKCYG